MDELLKGLIDKISSYQLVANLFPGVVFIVLLENTTRFSFSTDSIFLNLFIFYFAGIIVGRVSSLMVEPFLKWLKVKKRGSDEREPFIKFAPYSQYIEASKSDHDIAVLNETNNTYRSMIAVIFCAFIANIFDMVCLHLKIAYDNEIFELVCFGILLCLFIISYRKQTGYVRERVEKYFEGKD